MNNDSDFLKENIRSIPDFPKPGILFYDITTILSNPAALKKALDLFQVFLKDKGLSKIAAIDSRGFLFGGALADRLDLPLAIIRKPGKLPYNTVSESYQLEYGSDSLQIHTDAITADDKVVVVDDLLATGGTLQASCKLIEKLGGTVAAVAVVIELSFLSGREKFKDYNLYSLVQYDE